MSISLFKRKFLVAPILALVLSLGFSTSSLAASTTWSLYGQDSSCKSCMYVSSQGTISWNGFSTTFDGWANTIWQGGYGATTKLRTYALTKVIYNNGISYDSRTHDESKSVSGLNMQTMPISIYDKLAGYGLWSATVDAQGWTTSADFYYHAYGAGDHGL